MKFHSNYFNCNTDNILHFHVNFQQHSVAFVRLLPQYYNKKNTIPFLDTLLERRPDGSVKVQVYGKKTHTNQYLAFASHHPLHQKMGVAITLLNRCEEIVIEEIGREKERDTIKTALKTCGYSERTLNRVEQSMREKESNKKKDNSRKEKEEKNKGMVVLPYVWGSF